MVGNRCRCRDQAENVLQAKAEARTDGVSASNAVSAFGLSDSARMPAASKGKKSPARNFIFLLFFTSGNAFQNRNSVPMKS